MILAIFMKRANSIVLILLIVWIFFLLYKKKKYTLLIIKVMSPIYFNADHNSLICSECSGLRLCPVLDRTRDPALCYCSVSSALSPFSFLLDNSLSVCSKRSFSSLCFVCFCFFPSLFLCVCLCVCTAYQQYLV